MADDFEYHKNKSPKRTYVSRRISLPGFGEQPVRHMRIASKVFDSSEADHFTVEHGEVVIRRTTGGRQEIVAKFYEDDRDVFRLTFQRFSTATGVPLRTSFSFDAEEIAKLLEFISNLKTIHFPGDERLNISDQDLKKLLVSPHQARSIIAQNQALFLQLASDAITESDLVALGYRKKQLERFRKLLSDRDYFETEKPSLQSGDEAVWQAFFEKNKWVFGYGLAYVFLTSLKGRKLEQVVAGYDFSRGGKRTDALTKTRGAIEAICFVEIKKHTTKLLKGTDHYRCGCWPPSDELSGGVAQVQGTVEKAVRSLPEKTEPLEDSGDPTGEELFAYQPRSFLVVGSLNEFQTEQGINIEKYRSFELYRRNISRPEIITFDELYERAKFIVEHVDG